MPKIREYSIPWKGEEGDGCDRAQFDLIINNYSSSVCFADALLQFHVILVGGEKTIYMQIA